MVTSSFSFYKTKCSTKLPSADFYNLSHVYHDTYIYYNYNNGQHIYYIYKFTNIELWYTISHSVL